MLVFLQIKRFLSGLVADRAWQFGSQADFSEVGKSIGFSVEILQFYAV